MQTNFKYSLTRLCLRGGQMTLSPKLMGLFPDVGKLRAFDTVSNVEYELELKPPRTLLGLGPFFEAHGMDVNDQVVIARLEDDRCALTPIVHPKESGMSESDLTQLLAYKVLELNAPLSAAELRELFPHLPKDADIDRLLMNDNRLVKQYGRWLPRRRLLEGEAKAPPEPDVEAAHEGSPAEEPPHRVMVTPYPRGVMFPGEGDEAELLDLSVSHKARNILRDLGFRIESLSHAQFLAHADLGRHQYTVLVHIHPEEARLDWAALLARRRESQAGYVAVFGRHEDLARLISPAELARATLWSWEGLERAQAVLHSLPLSPYDLEPHFKRDGLFEHGLARFEATIAGRIAERGNFSAVLGRLASLRAPSIFLLEDVVADLDVPRDQVVKVLEVLAQPPFGMIAKVNDGEFCLRYGVAQGLLQLSEYALSLRDRLPSRRHERLQGLAEEEPGENADEDPEEVGNAKG